MATIGIVLGTNRREGNTAKVVSHLDAIYRALGQPTQIIDLSQLPPEIFSSSSYAEKPAGFQPFAEAVLQCAGLHVVTPEYNGGVPGILKYFIDMLKFPESLQKKPVCFTGLSTGDGGGLRSVGQLQAIFIYRKAYLFPETVLISLIGNHLTPEGRISNEKVLADLRGQAEGFIGFIKLFTGGQ
ncbi:MAG TPA: NADPH-dependent FMN reductase [Terrimicrobiaceae bacterium]|nr:NADPH-dependent FMN reductase [Terrimicrobiaceae bacterium]